jgi:hypothetical protein
MMVFDGRGLEPLDFFFRVPLFRGLVAGVFLEMEGLRLWQISTISLNWQWA